MTPTNTPTTRANTGEFVRDAREVGTQLRRLPWPMQAIIRRLRYSYNKRQLVDIIDAEVEKLAQLDRAYVHVRVPSATDADATQTLLPADRYQEYLDKLLRRPGFLEGLKNEARRVLRRENTEKEAYPSEGLALNETLPEEGTFVVRGSSRFHDAEALFETLNVGLVASIANWIINHSRRDFIEDIGLNDAEQTVSVLAWHCGIVGVLALVLDYLKPLDRRFAVTEVDVFQEVRDRQDSTWWTQNHSTVRDRKTTRGPVVERLYEVPQRRHAFVVLDVPAPNESGTANRRNYWKSQKERGLSDPGALSPKKWRVRLRSYIRKLPRLLETNGHAILILPQAIRGARGYTQDEHQLDGVEACLAEAGLVTLKDLQVKEEHVLSQPHVGNSRPLRRLIIVQRRVT